MENGLVAAERPSVVSLPLPQLSESAQFINMLERVARDPSVSVERLRPLWELRKDMLLYDLEIEFDAAMSAAQAEMEPVRADCANEQTKSRYASHAAMDAAIRPFYTKHGFGLSFDTGDAPDPLTVRVLCRVSRKGYTREYKIDMPADGKGPRGNDVMSRTHATGSAVTYGMRQLLRMIFNLPTRTDDDDGNAAPGKGTAATNKTVTAEQAEKIRGLIVETNSSIAVFYKLFGITKIEDLTTPEYYRAYGMLQTKASEQKKGGAQ